MWEVLVWVGWVVVYWTEAAQNQCNLSDGRCIYHVQLAPSCKDDLSLQTNRLQNDYNEKVNEIEKSLTHVSTDHSQRIKDLENKLSHIMTNVDSAEGSALVQPDHRRRHSGKDKFSETGKRKENALLNLLHEQFSVLRHDVAVAKRKVRETERILRDTRLKLNKTEEALLDTTRKLLTTEQNLADSKAENWRLRKDLEEKDLELNQTKAKLVATIRKLRDMEIELMISQEENSKLKDQLRDATLLLESTRKLLANALRKYHELNIRHELTVEELNNRTEELVSCYRGKFSKSN